MESQAAPKAPIPPRLTIQALGGGRAVCRLPVARVRLYRTRHATLPTASAKRVICFRFIPTLLHAPTEKHTLTIAHCGTHAHTGEFSHDHVCEPSLHDHPIA